MIYHIHSLLEFLIPMPLSKLPSCMENFPPHSTYFICLLFIPQNSACILPLPSLTPQAVIGHPHNAIHLSLLQHLSNSIRISCFSQYHKLFIPKFSEMKIRYLVSIHWQLVNLLINLKSSLLCGFQR